LLVVLRLILVGVLERGIRRREEQREREGEGGKASAIMMIGSIGG